jgi:hypothetical protein
MLSLKPGRDMPLNSELSPASRFAEGRFAAQKPGLIAVQVGHAPVSLLEGAIASLSLRLIG